MDAYNAVRENLQTFFLAAAEMGYEKAALIDSARAAAPLGARSMRQLQALSRQHSVPFEELLCYNLYQPYVLPEGCTVFFAVGKASQSGRTLFGKNSDKGSSPLLTGEYCYAHREINVVSYFDNPDGSHIVGVSAAGTLGLKMGLNSYGVAAATNFGNTAATARKQLIAPDVKAADRAQIIRDALVHKSALEAAQYAVARLMQSPMNTSGMVEFADAHAVYVVEATDDCIAVKKYEDTTGCRSNYFVTMDALNQPGDFSSFCRYHRAQQLLDSAGNALVFEDLLSISVDHHNGPNSICKHESPETDSSTLSAAIMEINGREPHKSVIHIALGKPCAAWRHPDGHVAIRMDQEKHEIPARFLDGTAFKEFAFAAPV